MEITAQNAIYLGEETGGKGRQFKARFLVPGLVKYDYGVCLLTKENADKFIQGFTGCPVIINHQNVTDDNVKDVAVGDIFSVWFDNNDGYYWCNGIIRDKEAIKLINEGYSVSCQYLITEYSDNTKGALHNGNPYDKVIENGKPEHLAIVNNPRYEGAIIAVNAILAQNEDKWITIHPHGDDSEDYRRLLIKDGETVEDAMHRNGWYEKRQAKETQKKAETKTETKPEQKQPDTKEEKGEETKSEQDKSIDKYLTDKSDSGFFYQSKGTSTYTNGEKRVEVEEFGENGGKYRAVFYDGKKRKDIKAYSTKRGMEKAVREHLEGGANKETKALETKTDLNAAKEKYEDIAKKYKEAEHKKWQSGISNEEYHQAWEDSAKYKKELTTARREYAESIMANFEAVEDNPWEEKQQARRDRFEELAYKNAVESSRAHQAFRDKMDVIPGGQPIHGARDARYREHAWDTLGKAVKLSEKSDYYADKAKSVGKAGISADDANAIAKLAQKYKSGVDSAEKRRIIDRVIDIHKRSTSTAPKTEDFSQYGFNVERNTDINRLQLKFDGKPDASTRSILKSYGFRWSPREGAWQRQLTGNAEYSLQQIKEKLTANNAFVSDFKNALYEALAGGIVDRLGELLAQNKSNNPKEKWITIKGNHILLKDGESIADAFKRVIGVSLQKSNNPKDNTDLSGGNRKYKEALAKVKRDNEKKLHQGK